MGQLTDMIEKYKAVAANIRPAVRNAFIETQDDYVDANLDQMLHGLNSQGGPIGTYANEDYAIAKHLSNPLPGFGIVDLRDTGAFYLGTYVSLSGNVITIQSVDSKDPKLEQKYSPKIFGLSPEYKRRYITENFKPAFISKLGL